MSDNKSAEESYETRVCLAPASHALSSTAPLIWLRVPRQNPETWEGWKTLGRTFLAIVDSHGVLAPWYTTAFKISTGISWMGSFWDYEDVLWVASIPAPPEG